jgi:hypothetical protein
MLLILIVFRSNAIAAPPPNKLRGHPQDWRSEVGGVSHKLAVMRHLPLPTFSQRLDVLFVIISFLDIIRSACSISFFRR